MLEELGGAEGMSRGEMEPKFVRESLRVGRGWSDRGGGV